MSRAGEGHHPHCGVAISTSITFLPLLTHENILIEIHILSKRPWNGEHRHHPSHGKRKVAILPAHGSFPRCSQISSYSRFVTSRGAGGPCCVRVLQSVWTDKLLFLQSHPQTARDVHECSRTDIRLWAHELCMLPLHKAFLSCSGLITPSLSVLHNFLYVPGSKTYESDPPPGHN